VKWKGEGTGRRWEGRSERGRVEGEGKWKG